ncbi:DoxX family protein [Paractinoplanes durhamensis]|uniref:Membrane protein n=1 Tax=Paractinoplanes durhamensis TaxID=113563 RepID=A0ABQ3Z036_9ACTN|nr:DoxX family protein [Actinoplanes durhamensis]GIE03198.1 membrane protein [Actinoplanes durhamensis]
MEIAYWIVGGLLALFYVFAGVQKVSQSQDKLRPTMGWVDQIPMRVVRLIGVLEILGGLGLILPPLTRIAPGLALAAAIGLVLIQIGGLIVHLRRGETSVIWLNIVLLILAAVAGWLATTWL